MKLVTNTYHLVSRLGPEEAIRLLAGAGFDGIDWTFSQDMGDDSPWLQGTWQDHAKKLLDTAGECGVVFRQAHAPVPSSKGTEPFDSTVLKKIHRAMEAAAFLGIEYIIVHPKQHLPYRENREQLFRESVAFYKGLIPCCESWGIKVCTENMWQRNAETRMIEESVCAPPEEFRDMIDAVDSPWVTGCLDVGHCGLVGQDPANAVRVLGHHRVSALHVHDVDLVEDSHTIPFGGKLDWQSITAALAEINYQGDFTFEPNGYFKNTPVPLWPEAAKFLAHTGRYLIAQIEKDGCAL